MKTSSRQDCEIDFLLDEFVSAEADERRRTATHLRRMLDRMPTESGRNEQLIPAVRPSGLFVLLPRSLAQRLVKVLEDAEEQTELSPPIGMTA